MSSDTEAPDQPIDGLLDLDEPEEAPAPRPTRSMPEDTEWHGDDTLFVDVRGNIHVRGGRFFHSKVVGSVRGKDAEAAMGALVARFSELEERFANLEREVKGSRNLVRSLKSVRSFVHWVEGAEAIGDFADLLERAHGLNEHIEHEVESRQQARLALAEEAERLAESTDWRATGEAMDRLMEQWKKIAPTGGDDDEAIWQRFRSARRSFSNRRSKHFGELKKGWSAARKAKEDLIERCQEMAGSTDWETTFDAMQAAMEEWKQVGSAGRDHDEELWQRFRAAREPFFAARRAHENRQRRERSQDRPRPSSGRRGRPPGGGRGPRTDGGRRPQAGGGLSASLAEIVGPLKDLFPADRSDDATKKPGSKGAAGGKSSKKG